MDFWFSKHVSFVYHTTEPYENGGGRLRRSRLGGAEWRAERGSPRGPVRTAAPKQGTEVFKGTKTLFAYSFSLPASG